MGESFEIHNDVAPKGDRRHRVQELQDEFGLSYLFIAHDLSVVRHICDRGAVTYLGQIVEFGTEAEIYQHPAHPYTQALLFALSVVPVPDPTLRGRREVIQLIGDVPSPADPPSDCRFRTRCWKAQERCAQQLLELKVRGGAHPPACHFAEERAVVQVADSSLPSPPPSSSQ